MKIPKLLKYFFPKKVRSVIKRALAPYLLRRSWMLRKNSSGDNHLATYWDAEGQPNRKQLIAILKNEVTVLHETMGVDCSVLEYGSHVGLNLKLLAEELGEKEGRSYFAVEPNQEAFLFLQNKLPMVHAFLGEDKLFCDQINFPPPGEYLGFINSVFYSMEPKRVKNVLKKLGGLCKTLVIGESIKNIDGMKSRLIENPECFEHPYKVWLEINGFEIAYCEVAEDPKPQLNGFIVAYKKTMVINEDNGK